MFIHIGDEHVIRSEEVVSIIDYNLLSSSSIVEEMIFNQRKNGNVTEAYYEDPKAIVITVDHIYFSSLSVSTLNKRAQLSHMLDKIDEIDEITHSTDD
ncbi:extracellular matrix regulator RemB [Alkalibacillus aidingensis]|uniref:extracellular matrix regulator RemB n=1 Tax=Alkalibacillus aidingensis TaxID=2747607 RepID=UPI001660F720|nr:extracellular matrix/biofilm biosynthesis regulator RemA family protein [Alkalibacillus aidingensis]